MELLDVLSVAIALTMVLGGKIIHLKHKLRKQHESFEREGKKVRHIVRSMEHELEHTKRYSDTYKEKMLELIDENRKLKKAVARGKSMPIISTPSMHTYKAPHSITTAELNKILGLDESDDTDELVPEDTTLIDWIQSKNDTTENRNES